MRSTMLGLLLMSLIQAIGLQAQEPTWAAMAVEDAPSLREAATIIDAGGLLVVWGGAVHLGEGRWRYLADGAVYDPEADRWTPTTAAGAPTARAWHSSVWTGSELIIWGGQGESEFRDGAAFDPRRNRWRSICSKGAPRERIEHCAAWVGKRMIVWSGVTEERSFIDGGAYDPVADSWAPIAEVPMPFGRRALKAVVIGDRFHVWGGINGSSVLDDGATFDPKADTWTAMTAKGAPPARANAAAIALGEKMLVWGGSSGIYGKEACGDGALYDPVLDSWVGIGAKDAPSPRVDHVLAPFERGFLVFGGRLGDERRIDGAIYDSGLESWRKIPSAPRRTPFQASLGLGDDLLLLAWDPESRWASRLELKATSKR